MSDIPEQNEWYQAGREDAIAEWNGAYESAYQAAHDDIQYEMARLMLQIDEVQKENFRLLAQNAEARILVDHLNFLRDNDVEISGYNMDHDVIEEFWERLEAAVKRLENLP